MAKKAQVRSNYEIYKRIRKDWGAISPAMKVIPDKRHKAPKHKNKIYSF